MQVLILQVLDNLQFRSRIIRLKSVRIQGNLQLKYPPMVLKMLNHHFQELKNRHPKT